MTNFALLILIATTAQSDFSENQAIRDRVDEVLADVDVAALSDDELAGLYANRRALNIAALIPGFGSFIIDTKVYGGPRVMAIIFDWTIGGIIPLALTIISFFVSPEPQEIMQWTALGLYAATRFGINLVINSHITMFNDTMERRIAARRATTLSVTVALPN